MILQEGFSALIRKRILKRKIRIGTRGSKLALWQAGWIKARLEEQYPEITVSLIRIKTTGDKILDVPLSKVGGKALFVKEIEEALLRGEIDLAVHSMKDMPIELPEGLYIAGITERIDPRDALIISQKSNPNMGINKSLLYDLPQGARVGTSSLRRQCQLRAIRADLDIINLRGNLDTRIRRLDEGQFDAIIVASAGVKRLGLESRISEYLLPEIILPAIGQGVLGIEARKDDTYIGGPVHFLNDEKTSLCVKAERAFLKRLEGGCQVPIAAHARINNCLLVMDGLVGSVSGDRIVRGYIEGEPKESEAIGIKLAEDLLLRGARGILDEVYGKKVSPSKI